MSVSSSHSFGNRSEPDFEPTILEPDACPYDDEEEEAEDDVKEPIEEKHPDTDYIVTSSFKLNANTPLPNLAYRRETRVENRRDSKSGNEGNHDDIDDEAEDEYDIISAEDLVPGTPCKSSEPRDIYINITAAEGCATNGTHVDEARRLIVEYAALSKEELRRKLKHGRNWALDKALRAVFGKDLEASEIAEERIRTTCELVEMAGRWVGALPQMGEALYATQFR